MNKLTSSDAIKSPQSLIVLILGLLMTMATTIHVGASQKRENQLRTEADFKEVQTRINSRIVQYENSLLQARAFIMAQDSFSREKFKNYVESTEILNRYPGIQGFGYAVKIPAHELDKHEKKMRSLGLKNYKVWPQSPKRSEYFSIIYLEPMDWRNERAIGFDMFSEPVRQKAMADARDSGKPVATGKVTLVQEVNKNAQPGILIYVPLYKGKQNAESTLSRRENLLGFVYAPFRTHDLFSAIFKNYNYSINFQIFNEKPASQSSLIYDSRNKLSNENNILPDTLSRIDQIKIANHVYYISYTPKIATKFAFVYFTAFLGLLITALIWWIVLVSKISESNLKNERTKYEAVFEKSPTAIAVLSGKDHSFEMTNPAYQKLIGHNGIVGKTVREALPELVGQQFFDLLDKVFLTGEPVSIKDAPIVFTTKKGQLRKRFVDFVYQRIDEHGIPYGIFVQAIDTTDKVLSQNKLMESVRARDEFLSIASHELKTPLTSLKLQIQLHQRAIKKGDPEAYSPKRVNDIVAMFDRQIYRLTRLVDDMLDISRIRSGKLKIQRVNFNFCELVEEVLTRMNNQFIDANYDIPKFCKCEKTEGDWDRLRLEQVITNLLTNCIRYGSNKPIEVKVESNETNVLLSVKDQGIGIADEIKSKIFDRFERAMTVSEISGLGLGLYITKKIVLAHGGKIWVESEIGKGSTFFVELPRHKSKEETEETIDVL